MNGISILIIDDQYADSEFLRGDLISKTGINESNGQLPAHDCIEAVFCSGQSRRDNLVVNDYNVIKDAVKQRWGNAGAGQWNLVLLDVRFDSGILDVTGSPKGGPDDDTFGLNVRKWLRSDFPELPVVLLSSKRQEEIEDQSEYYLSKVGINELEVKRVLLDYGQLSVEQKRHLLVLEKDTICVSSEMIKVYRDAYLHAQSLSPVLILGESGSGKEALARYIHLSSPRKNNSFVPLNMSSIPESLAEAELFGYEKGAFTGATREGKKGYFEQANGGTLFFDEIGDMNLQLQPKILRVLQEKTVRKISASKDTQVDVRLVSATHRNIEGEVIAGTFREDLFHRINLVTIIIPPLRERHADILPLAQAILNKSMAEEGKVGMTFSEDAKCKLEGYDFPGNVRELENMIRRLVVETGNNRVIFAKDIGGLLSPPNTESKVLGQDGKSPAALQSACTNTVDAEIAMGSAMQLPSQTNINLANLHEIIAALPVDKDDPALQGSKPRLEGAIQVLIQRCTGAALERCKRPMDKEYALSPAMQLLLDDETVETGGSLRALDKVLNRKQKTKRVNNDELIALVDFWKKHRPSS